MKHIQIIFLSLCLVACSKKVHVPLDTFVIAEKLCANHGGVKAISVETVPPSSDITMHSDINVACKNKGTYATQVVTWNPSN